MNQTNRLAIVADAFNPDPRIAAGMARESGFAGLQFEAFGSKFNLTDLSATGLREFRHVLSSENQAFVGTRADFGPQGIGAGADVDRILHQLEKVFRATGALGSSLVCSDVGPLPEPPIARKQKPKITSQQAGLLLLPDPTSASDPANVVEPLDPAVVAEFETRSGATSAALAAIGELADRYRITLAIRAELSSFSAIDHALKMVRCPWLGIDLDPVAMLRDQWPFDDIFTTFANRILHVRARDALAGDNRRTRPAVIGSGHIQWPKFNQLLIDADFKSFLTIDPFELPNRIQGAETGLAVLKPLII